MISRRDEGAMLNKHCNRRATQKGIKDEPSFYCVPPHGFGGQATRYPFPLQNSFCQSHNVFNRVVSYYTILKNRRVERGLTGKKMIKLK